MKNLILILALLLSVDNANAFGGKRKTEPVLVSQPSLLDTALSSGEYQLIFSENYSTRFASTVTALTPDCLNILSKAKMRLYKEAEASCSDVLSVINIQRIIDTSRVPDNMQSINIDVYCKPRQFSDIAIMSLFKKCSEAPQQECFSPQLIEKLDQIKPTTFKEMANLKCGESNN